MYATSIILYETDTSIEENGSLSILRAIYMMTSPRSESTYPKSNPRGEAMGAVTTTRNVTNIIIGTIGRTSALATSA